MDGVLDSDALRRRRLGILVEIWLAIVGVHRRTTTCRHNVVHPMTAARVVVAFHEVVVEMIVAGDRHPDVVAAKEGEKIVFTWQIWPDKAFFQAAEEKMHQDERMDMAGEPPFDATRLILGCFEPILAMGRAGPR